MSPGGPIRASSAEPRSPGSGFAQLATTQPIARPVPADDANFLASKGPVKLAWRVLRRKLELAASGQRACLHDSIEPSWKRAVWLHVEAPQIGDALMDLAPRSLLAESGIALDLFAPAPTAALFSGDRAFSRVIGDEAMLDPRDYDFAITDSFAWRALAAKRRRLPRLPWVSVRNDYLAYDFQRGLLATRRCADLLRVVLDPADEQRHARQKLLLDDGRDEPNRDGGDADGGDADPGDADRGDADPGIAIALGGVHAERTYRRWPEVARALLAALGGRFTLLGSENARLAAHEFAASCADIAGPACVDLVARTDLHQARRVMQRSRLVLCADGGLMHLAMTTTTPVVALFDASVDPAWRLPLDFAGVALRASGRDVNLIAPERVARAALDALATAAVRAAPAGAARVSAPR